MRANHISSSLRRSSFVSSRCSLPGCAIERVAMDLAREHETRPRRRSPHGSERRLGGDNTFVRLCLLVAPQMTHSEADRELSFYVACQPVTNL